MSETSDDLTLNPSVQSNTKALHIAKRAEEKFTEYENEKFVMSALQIRMSHLKIQELAWIEEQQTRMFFLQQLQQEITNLQTQIDESQQKVCKAAYSSNYMVCKLRHHMFPNETSEQTISLLLSSEVVNNESEARQLVFDSRK